MVDTLTAPPHPLSNFLIARFHSNRIIVAGFCWKRSTRLLLPTRLSSAGAVHLCSQLAALFSVCYTPVTHPHCVCLSSPVAVQKAIARNVLVEWFAPLSDGFDFYFFLKKSTAAPSLTRSVLIGDYLRRAGFRGLKNLRPSDHNTQRCRYAHMDHRWRRGGAFLCAE